MENIESIALQQQVNDLSERVRVLQQQMAQVIDAQASCQSRIELLENNQS
jgi:prefoldin subunit 5